MEKIDSEFRFHSFECRLETFKNWPFTENCACTPKKLAEAGFVYSGSDQEPDLVICFVCRKELDGWTPDDDPWQEHVSHSGKCPFIKDKNPESLTCAGFLLLEKTRVSNIVTRYTQESNSLWNKGVSSLEELMGSKGKYKI
ncbi:baculoviral IAP repeat-containing protein 5.1 [Ischnura elegans]|uniref:baculoviral IAP repeat-containing protein 5.1 n=1 Tax=Ischnura elegans TaxID=197161 RepID=UPI001ED88548|nr:baculoviral IAP repeat-containing protein 5.1 [Ischnura elegans]